MKKLKYLLIAVLTFFVLEFNVMAVSSNFESTINMEPDITENRVNVVLGFTGEEVMIINQTLSYDSSKLKLVEVLPMDNFEVTTSVEKKEGSKYQTLKILADSNYSFNASNYCIAVFEVNPSFKVKKKADVFLYGVEATGPSQEKYRTSGNIMTMNRESLSEMYFLVSNIDNFTSTKYWLSEHISLIVIIVLIIIGIVIVIFLIPSKRKKEARENKVNDQLKPENYNPENGSVKIDQQTIDSIGAVEKPVDMSQAIVYNEDVKPFGEIIGKSETVIENNNNNEFSSNNISVFENRNPENYQNDNNNQTEQLVQVQMPTENNNEELKPIMVKEITDVSTTINGYDPFNAKVEIPTPQDINPIPNSMVNENQNPPLDTPQETTPSTSNSDFIELPEKKETLGVINPQNFDNVETLEDNIELPKLDEKKSNEANNPTNLMILILIAILSMAFISSVSAENSKYNVEELRDCIVGRTSYNKELDYNGDGKVDILDLVMTKNLDNCNFEELINTDPGFKELHGQSNNLISTDPNRVTTTKKSGLFGKKTTTKKTTAKKETTKKNTTDKSITTKKTTTKKTTTAKSTTTKKTTTKKATTTKSTTTKKTTTKKSTTAKTTLPSYTINITASNGSVSKSSVTLKTGSSTTISLTPNTGYTISQANVTCSNVEFSLSGTRLVLKNPTGNASCRLNFVLNDKIKVTLKVNTGKGNSVLINPSISYTTKSIDNGGSGTYNSTWKTNVPLPAGYKLRENPSCGSYSNGVFSITIPASATTCNLYFDPILYSFNVYISTQSPAINTGTDSRIYFGESKKIDFVSSSNFSQITCTGGKSIRLSKSGTGPYNYAFTYSHETASNAECRIS